MTIDAPQPDSAALPPAAEPRAAPGAAQPPRRVFRAVVEFAVQGDLRYLSHHEELRVLQRALTRAGWPVAYSQGFNPRPQAALALPRNLGTSSDCEVALVDMLEPRGAAELEAALRPQLPTDMPLRSVIAPAVRRALLPERADYTVSLDAPSAAIAAANIPALLAERRLMIRRDYGPEKPSRPADIRPYIESLRIEDATLHIELSFEQQRSARPSEILNLLKLPAGEFDHWIHRRRITWNISAGALWADPHAIERG
ncbi:MAG: DUF2344 domain-containing protein [Phycisphaerales bacterium]|nr:DUF2344 domain-containing protein [Phycisphaerales bacterium]